MEVVMKRFTHYYVFLILFCWSCNKQDSSSGPAEAGTAQDTSAMTGTPSPTTTPRPTPAPIPTQTPAPAPTKVSQTMTVQFMTLLNNHRLSIGLKAIVLDEGMSDIAIGHSEDMASGKVAFGHDGFSSRCGQARAIMGGGNLCSENVAMGQKTAQAAFDAWMNSPGHRANMESARATHTGFGYAKSGTGTFYWTQIFLEVN